jgi:two-component system, NarL family, nitrate/nitrite response regulator NarL
MRREGRDLVPEAVTMNDLISKKDSAEELSYAIRRILSGGFYVPTSMSVFLRDHQVEDSLLERLTQRERSVLSLYAQGYSIKKIADELNVSVKTAETHRNNLGRKMGHPNRRPWTPGCRRSIYLR